MTRRRQHVPWKAAGRASELQPPGDAVVQETGWVFNNATGRRLTLEELRLLTDMYGVSVGDVLGIELD